MKRTAIVMPLFNEEPSARGIAESILSLGPGRLIVVDDGSTDATVDALSDLDLVLLRHLRNRGKGFALSTGIRYAIDAGFERIVTVDGDGQHRPGDIPHLIAAARSKPGALIIAARVRRTEDAPSLRRFANRTADFWISWACGRAITDTQSGLRLYPADALTRVATRPLPGQGFAFESALLIDLAAIGTDFGAIAIDALYHDALRTSHYRPWRDTWSIVHLVGVHLLRRGMYPMGLMRALGLVATKPPERTFSTSGPRQ